MIRKAEASPCSYIPFICIHLGKWFLGAVCAPGSVSHANQTESCLQAAPLAACLCNFGALGGSWGLGSLSPPPWLCSLCSEQIKKIYPTRSHANQGADHIRTQLSHQRCSQNGEGLRMDKCAQDPGTCHLPGPSLLAWEPGRCQRRQGRFLSRQLSAQEADLLGESNPVGGLGQSFQKKRGKRG